MNSYHHSSSYIKNNLFKSKHDQLSMASIINLLPIQILLIRSWKCVYMKTMHASISVHGEIYSYEATMNS